MSLSEMNARLRRVTRTAQAMESHHSTPFTQKSLLYPLKPVTCVIESAASNAHGKSWRLLTSVSLSLSVHTTRNPISSTAHLYPLTHPRQRQSLPSTNSETLQRPYSRNRNISHKHSTQIQPRKWYAPKTRGSHDFNIRHRH